MYFKQKVGDADRDRAATAMNTKPTKLTLLLVSSLTVMSGATIAPALPVMLAHFSDVQNAQLWVRLVLTIPALFILSVAPAAGYIADRWGRRTLLLPALILYGIAGTSGLYLESLGSILAGRALLGVAVAGVMTAATALVADYYEGHARARFMGIQAAFMGIGGIVFLTSGGLLADMQWRLPFAIYAFSLIVFPLAYYLLPEAERAGTHPRGNTQPPQKDSGPLTGAINDGRMRSHVKLLALIYGLTFISMLTFYLVPTQIPFYLEKISEVRPSLNGFAIGTAMLFSSAVALLYGRIRKRLGFIPILGLSSGLMGAGYIVISAAGSYAVAVGGLSICGLGMGMSMPNFATWLTTETPASIRGRAVGGLTTALFLGQFASPLVSQPVSGWVGLASTFLVAAALLLVLSVLLLTGHRRIQAMVTVAEPVETSDGMARPQRIEKQSVAVDEIEKVL
jgi:MFS family permease